MDNQLQLEKLRQALRWCWGAETSFTPVQWSAENPAWGQCAVTACVVHDLFGGEIVWTTAMTPDGEEHSHFFNRLPNGTTVDLTCEQFPANTKLIPPEGTSKTGGTTGPSFPTTREYVLSFPATETRYHLLRAKVKHALAETRT